MAAALLARLVTVCMEYRCNQRFFCLYDETTGFTMNQEQMDIVDSEKNNLLFYHYFPELAMLFLCNYFEMRQNRLKIDLSICDLAFMSRKSQYLTKRRYILLTEM